jgi:hypothetical protein
VNIPDIEAYIKSFLSYVEDFRQGSPEDIGNIEYKRGHSLRVLENAKAIAGSLNLEPSCCRLALLAALLHDVGRFPQYRRYKTFLDRLSENHGLAGARALRGSELLAGIAPDEQKTIRCAVLLHNRRHIPAYVSANVRKLTAIVRDADKLDILPVIISNLDPESDQNPVITLHLKPHPTAYTPSVYASVLSGRLGKYKEMRWVNDFKITLCSWVYDFNFPAARQLCLERGCMDALLQTLPDTPEMKALSKKIQGVLFNGDTQEALKN